MDGPAPAIAGFRIIFPSCGSRWTVPGSALVDGPAIAGDKEDFRGQKKKALGVLWRALLVVSFDLHGWLGFGWTE